MSKRSHRRSTCSTPPGGVTEPTRAPSKYMLTSWPEKTVATYTQVFSGTAFAVVIATESPW
eukprot:3407958-Rhodomonas_salina.3